MSQFITTINPATGKVIHEYPLMTAQKVKDTIKQANNAFLKWADASYDQRANCLLNAAELLDKSPDSYAKIITEEMGKPISQAVGEIQKCAWVLRHYAESAEKYLQPRIIPSDYKKSYVCYKPLGVIFAIMPWNFPFWQVFRFAAPNLMLGNSALLSHAPICTGTAITIEKLLREAGLPNYVFNSLIIDNNQAAEVIANHHVKGVTLTGSEKAGAIVGAESAKSLKKVVLELGGSDPYIILEDADLEHAAKVCVQARMNNAGQVCISPKRVICVEAVYEQFKEKVIEELQEFSIADPSDPTSKFGPMARADLRDLLHSQVQESIKKGAQCLLGGKPITGDGFYYPPTLLVNIQPGMPAYDDELFGPVFSLLSASDVDDAIRIANDTSFGLAAAIFSKNEELAERIARDKLHAGTCAVNSSVSSDPRLPFGGINMSGYGRELSSEGMHEFANIKTVVINK